jgi:hypothetical protein
MPEKIKIQLKSNNKIPTENIKIRIKENKKEEKNEIYMEKLFDFPKTNIKPTEETEYWAYYPALFAMIPFEKIYDEIKRHCVTYKQQIYGKEYEAKRISCLVGRKHYGELPVISWKDVEIAKLLKDILEQQIMANYPISDNLDESKIDDQISYLLCHIYRDGKDTIGYHRDREALYRPVISLTFAPNGVCRKFRFRNIGEKSGFTHEFKLSHGDLLIMKAGCQRKYKHSVPVEKTITKPRINLTFRYFDPNGKNNPTRTKI